MLTFKTVQQFYSPDQTVLRLLEQFRQMMNDCIQIGLAENISSLKALSSKAYRQLREHDVMSCYKVCAISAAAGVLRNYRRTVRESGEATIPYARRLRLTTCYGFKIQDGRLLLPHRSKEPIEIPLTHHIQVAITGHTVRSVTLTSYKLSLAYAKDVSEVKPQGFMGLDCNLENVTLATEDGSVLKYSLSQATQIKSTYREVRSHIRRNDERIRRQVASKYGRKQREKVKQILHDASKQIVQQAKEHKFGIIMENLTGIRRLYRKGNGRGRPYRGQMNSWSFFELQRQIEYKARWEGLPVIYVKPHGTSAKCSICGSRMARIPEESRKLRCARCSLTMDRDVNAARNILARGVRFAPIALPPEAMVQEPQLTGNPESRWERVNSKAPARIS